MKRPPPQSADMRYKAPAPPRERSPFDGVLLVDKPGGPTSHDVVAAVRKHFGIQKVGHGGTLDPQATGLLVILVGRGTKLSNYLMSGDKAYEGTMRLGVETDSQDADGRVVREADASGVTEAQVREAMARYAGDMLQTPPMVSAVKVGGVPLYKRARKGQVVEREPRLIHIYQFDLVSFEPPEATFRIRCTKGTYVRTLCADVGKDLECGAHLSALRRTESGELNVSDAVSYDELLKMGRESLADLVIPMADFASKLRSS